MSIETARIECLRSPSSSKNSSSVAAGAPRRAPDDPAGLVVGDVGQVAHARGGRRSHRPRSGSRSLKSALIEVIGDDALDDPPDRVPGDPQQRLDLALGHPLGAERDQILELAGVPGAAARPRDRLDPHPAIPAVHPSQLVLQKTAMAGQVQMPPAPHAAGRACPRYTCPHTEHAIRRRRSRTLTITPSAVSLTPVTLAPRSASSLFNAVVTRTPSLL